MNTWFQITAFFDFVASSTALRPKILLIDEVDVFFQEGFYGSIYAPSASLEDTTISNLLDLIWNERNADLSLDRIQSTEEYKACLVRF